MQTFLPYPSFGKSVEALDYRRLGKQRIEARQIYDLITGAKDNNWKNHPAVKMWVGYADALAAYHDICILEWTKRGYKNNMPMLFNDDMTRKYDMPWWFGNYNFHKAMRARLIEKDGSFYGGKFNQDTGFNGGKYLWPVTETKKFVII